MREITAATRYIKMATAKEGETLIQKGKLIEIRPGKFGDTMIFEELSSGEEVGLGAGGQLKFLLGKGSIKLNGLYTINYKGKKSLKGGRTANDFQVFSHEVETPAQEDEEEDFFTDIEGIND
ncbi:MAG: hypothetical protein KBD17_02285 [Candidatus Pacebacteria bacterium]|nr:hypothetical protein [Candidatus Paceibacterota bacterium]